MARKGLGKGLDVLIPDFYDEDFGSDSQEVQVDKSESEDIHSDEGSGEGLQTLQEIKIQE